MEVKGDPVLSSGVTTFRLNEEEDDDKDDEDEDVYEANVFPAVVKAAMGNGSTMALETQQQQQQQHHASFKEWPVAFCFQWNSVKACSTTLQQVRRNS